MPITTGEIQIGAAPIAADIDHATLHTALPDATGSNQSSAGVQAVAPSSSGGVISITAISFTGGASSGACTHVGFWHGVPGSGGTWRGYLPLTGSNVFDSSGAYVVDSVTITGTAS